MNCDHARLAGDLTTHHRDFFDRVLIARALVEKPALVSRDSAFDACGVSRLQA